MGSAKKSRKKASDKGPLAQLAKLGEDGATGVLHTSGSAGDVDVFLMLGDIIACSSPDDGEHLRLILVSDGVISPGDLAAVRDSAGPDEDLVDLLVTGGVVPPDRMMAAQSVLFHDNLGYATGLPDRTAEFEALDSVFPPNMQLGLDRAELLDGVGAWADGAASSIAALVDPERFWAAGTDEAPATAPAVIWEQLRAPHVMANVIAIVGPPRIDALTAADGWIAEGALVETEEDDYSKAARGGFVKSYEVLDKVDLQGVDIIGTGEEAQVPSAVSLEAIEAVALDEDAHDDHDEADIEALEEEEFDDEDVDEPTQVSPLRTTRPDMPVRVLEGDEPSGDIEIGEDDFDIFGDDDEDAGAAAVVEEEDVDAGGTATVELSNTPFDREQLNDFETRIQVFNNIFRVIFATFAEHIGKDKSLQRFNALLGSGQRQYPELFKDLRVDDDGSVSPGPLINNLALCPPGDYAALLHQGLYELIFSHLYDAKDLLPGDAESEMMEKIVVFERHLHQM